MQDVLMKCVVGAVRQFDRKGEVTDVPVRELASAALAWDRLEERRREALGKAKLAPVKSEPRSQSRGSRSSRVLVESDQPTPATVIPPPV